MGVNVACDRGAAPLEFLGTGRTAVISGMARKCNSYKGHILHTDSLKFAKRYHVYDSARRARRLISNASKIRQRAA